jgi:hypothetical protein
MIDVEIIRDGSVVGFRPATVRAQAFFAEQVNSDGWQWRGPVLWVDHRVAASLLDGIYEAGLTTEGDGG